MYSVKHYNEFYSISGHKFQSFQASSGHRYTKFTKTDYISVHKFQVVWDPIYTNVNIC